MSVGFKHLWLVVFSPVTGGCNINCLYSIFCASYRMCKFFLGVPEMCKAPLVLLRPRAWNMMEQNVMVT